MKKHHPPAVRVAAQRMLAEIALLAIAMSATAGGTALAVAKLPALAALLAALLGGLTLFVLRRYWNILFAQMAWLRLTAR